MVVTASEVARRPGMFLGTHAHDGLQGLVELVITSAVDGGARDIRLRFAGSHGWVNTVPSDAASRGLRRGWEGVSGVSALVHMVTANPQVDGLNPDLADQVAALVRAHLPALLGSDRAAREVTASPAAFTAEPRAGSVGSDSGHSVDGPPVPGRGTDPHP